MRALATAAEPSPDKPTPAAAPCKLEDEREPFVSSGVKDVPEKPATGARHLASRSCATVASIGLCATVLCAVIVARSSKDPNQLEQPLRRQQHICDFSSSSTGCPGIVLLESEELHEAMSASLSKAGHTVLTAEDDEAVEAAVHDVFLRIRDEMPRDARELAGALSRTRLLKEEKEAILELVRLLSEADVQALGRFVAEAIRDSPAKGAGHLRVVVEKALEPRMDEVRQLRERFVSEAARKLWGAEHPEELPLAAGTMFEVTLESQSIRALDANSSTAAQAASESALSGDHDVEKKARALSAGAAQGARALLDYVLVCARQHHPKSHLGLGELLRFGDAALSWPCAVRDEAGSGVDAMNSIVCPLRFGALGVDALRASFVADMSYFYTYDDADEHS